MNTSNNLNIEVSRDNKGNTYIDIIPYNRELNIDYVKYWVSKLIREIKKEGVALRIEGYHIDGLSETNFGLINKGCVIYNKYYPKEHRTVKVLK